MTIVIIGLSTFLIGSLPGYASIGIAAPIIFIAMRLLQGLALGGEYGGAWTAWIQTTATLALFGLTAGQAVVCQFYSLFFLTQTLKVDGTSANIMVAVALLIGTPFFVFFGSLSDRIGRKPIIMADCLIAALSFFPLFKALEHYTNPTLESATQKSPIVVIANPNECSFQFNPVGTAKFTTSCDIAKGALLKAGLNYENVVAPAGTLAQIKVGETVVNTYNGKSADAKAQGAAFDKTLAGTPKSAGYPAKADPALINWPMAIVILTILVIFVTMVYGPIAAMLVEMFPS